MPVKHAESVWRAACYYTVASRNWMRDVCVQRERKPGAVIQLYAAAAAAAYKIPHQAHRNAIMRAVLEIL